MKNKTVLITGTSKGIGFEIEKLLSSKGYKTFGCARSEIKKENYLSCDLSTKEGCEKLFESAKKYLGQIDILVNNVGEYCYSNIEKTSYETLERMTKLNFYAPYYLTSLVIPDMKKNKWGRIVNIGSISGIIGEGGATLYSATKSMFTGFSKALALEVAEFGITVNTINPGWVETELSKNGIEESDLTYQDNLDVIPQKRFIEPIEVGNLVYSIIQDESKGLTGQSINLCAGLTCG